MADGTATAETTTQIAQETDSGSQRGKVLRADVEENNVFMMRVPPNRC
jgi:hypothetical protein